MCTQNISLRIFSIVLERLNKVWIGASRIEGTWRWVGLYTGLCTSEDLATGVLDEQGGEEDVALLTPDSRAGRKDGRRRKKNCIEMLRTGKWKNQHCSDRRSFFCERGKSVVMKPFINFS